MPGSEDRLYAVLAVGELNVDLILSGMTEPPKFGGEVLAEHLGMHAGGSTANVAACCAQLGLSAALVSNVGSDSFGDFLIGEMERLGVASEPTSESVCGDVRSGLWICQR